MTVVTAEAKARTLLFHSNDVGYVSTMAGHSLVDTGTEDLVFLEMFKTSHYADISLNQWISRMPDKIAEAHLKLTAVTIRKALQDKNDVLPR
jgi:oxalate decarboxylase